MIDFACKQFSLQDIMKCGLGLTKTELIILQFFLKHDAYICTKSISTKLKLDESTVQRAVKKLHEAHMIVKTQENFSTGGYQYLYKAVSREKIAQTILQTIESWKKKVHVAFDDWVRSTSQ
jgi:predicted transcriptional regulator